MIAPLPRHQKAIVQLVISAGLISAGLGLAALGLHKDQSGGDSSCWCAKVDEDTVRNGQKQELGGGVFQSQVILEPELPWIAFKIIILMNFKCCRASFQKTRLCCGSPLNIQLLLLKNLV